MYEITVSMEGEENDNQGSEDNVFSTENPDLENVADETSETEENQTEQTSEGDSEGTEGESEGTEGESGEQSEGEPAETEPTATPENYVSLIQETNEHLANIEIMHGALFGVLGLFLGVYLIHDFFDSVKKI